MASSNVPFLLSFISMIFLSTVAPSMGSCSTRFSNNRVFDSCLDLPTLSSSLHFTYTAPSATLSIAFVAPPAAPEGWVAWGINPSRPAMLGTQALLAYRHSNGSIVADTYNITRYDNVVRSPIDYPVSDLAAEASGSNFVIFATLQLPAGTTVTNHVWQVGPSMTQGRPAVHAMRPANLNAVGIIDFVRVTSSGPSPAPTSPSPQSPIPPATPGGPSNAGFHAVAASWSLLLVGLLHLLH